MTIPEDPTVATPGVTLLHVPPGVASYIVVVDPWQKMARPVTGNGSGLTVTTALTAHPAEEV